MFAKQESAGADSCRLIPALRAGHIANRHTGKASGRRDNKRELCDLVEAGTVPGLIGYSGREPIGWISLGPREDYAKLQRSPIMKPVDEKPVWSIVCTFVGKAHRGAGFQRRLLQAAIDHARANGVRLLEAYPVD